MMRYLILAIAVLLTIGAGIAIADVGDDGTVINACAKANNGQLRIVDGPDDCKKSEDFVSWDQEGPAGTNGLDGADGAAGANGADGVDGVDGESCSVVEDPSGTYTMTCPDSSVTWGGPTTTTTTQAPACAVDADCPFGYRCDGDVCVPLIPNGGACTGDLECRSGHCISGDCCAVDCICQRCSLNGGSCAHPFPLGTDPNNDCPVGFTCDGFGGCVLES